MSYIFNLSRIKLLLNFNLVQTDKKADLKYV